MSNHTGLFLFILLIWIFFGQPVTVLTMIWFNRTNRFISLIGFVVFVLNATFAICLYKMSQYKGAFNFSGHGRYEDIPDALLYSMFSSLLSSFLLFFVFVAMILVERNR